MASSKATMKVKAKASSEIKKSLESSRSSTKDKASLKRTANGNLKKNIKKSSKKEESEDEDEEVVEEQEDDDLEELNDEYDESESEDGGADAEPEDEDEDDDSESDYEDLAPDNGPLASVPNKRQKIGSEAFSKAITAILGSKIKAHDVADPILVRNKRVAKDLEEKKLEAKAKRAIAVEKKSTFEKDHIKRVIPEDETKLHAYLEHEKVLKKTAQKGVVKLFNAIRAAQKNTQETLTAHKKGKVVKALDKEAANNMSKEQFLDLIRSS